LRIIERSRERPSKRAMKKTRNREMNGPVLKFPENIITLMGRKKEKTRSKVNIRFF
jgi:hypothetical protein